MQCNFLKSGRADNSGECYNRAITFVINWSNDTRYSYNETSARWVVYVKSKMGIMQAGNYSKWTKNVSSIMLYARYQTIIKGHQQHHNRQDIAGLLIIHEYFIISLPYTVYMPYHIMFYYTIIIYHNNLQSCKHAFRNTSWNRSIKYQVLHIFRVVLESISFTFDFVTRMFDKHWAKMTASWAAKWFNSSFCNNVHMPSLGLSTNWDSGPLYEDWSLSEFPL